MIAAAGDYIDTTSKKRYAQSNINLRLQSRVGFVKVEHKKDLYSGQVPCKAYQGYTYILMVVVYKYEDEGVLQLKQNKFLFHVLMMPFYRTLISKTALLYDFSLKHMQKTS